VISRAPQRTDDVVAEAPAATPDDVSVAARGPALRSAPGGRRLAEGVRYELVTRVHGRDLGEILAVALGTLR
jgi:hypothetical protein